MPTSKKKTPAFQRSTGPHMEKAAKLDRPVLCSRCGVPFHATTRRTSGTTSVSDGSGGLMHVDEGLCKMYQRRRKNLEDHAAAMKYVADRKAAQEIRPLSEHIVEKPDRMVGLEIHEEGGENA